MGAWTPAALKLAIDAFLAGQTTIHASFHTSNPGTTGANEYTANGLARVPIGAQTTTSDSNSADGTNDASIESPAATGPTAPITDVGLWTAAVGGTFLGSHQLSSPITLAIGQKIRIPAGDLDYSLVV